MARYSATQNSLVMFFESGTYANTSGNFWPGLVQSNNIEPQEGTFSVRYLTGAGRGVDMFVQGPQLFKGTTTIKPQDFRMLAWAAGSCVDGGSPSPYTHVITPINNNVGTAFTSGPMNPFLSFAVEEYAVAPGTGTNSGKLIKGCVVDTYELEGEEGGELINTISWFGTSGAYISGTPTAINNFIYGSSSIGSITDRNYIFSDVNLAIPSGTVYESLTKFKFTLKNNVINRPYLVGSRTYAPPMPDVRDLMLDVQFDSMSERNKTLYENYYQGGSDFNCILSVNALAGSRDTAIVLSGCRIMDTFNSPKNIEGINPDSFTVNAKTMNANVNDYIMRYNPW